MYKTFNNKKHFFNSTLFFLIYLMIAALSCKPSIGTPWYPRAASDDGVPLYVGEITVAGAAVKARDGAKSFHDSPDYTVAVPNALSAVSITQIKVKLFSDPKLEKAVHGASFTLEVAGDSVPLQTGAFVPIQLRIKPSGDQYAVIEKTLKIKRLDKSTAYLGGLTVYGIAAVPAPDFAASGNYTVSVPSNIESVAKEQIAVSLFSDEKKENPLSGAAVSVSGDAVLLAPGVPAAVRLTITPPNLYKAFQTTVIVTRKSTQGTPLGDRVSIREIKIKDKVASFVNGSYTLTVPYAVSKIVQSDIAVSLVTNDEAKTPIPATVRLLTGSSVQLAKDGTPAYLALEITLTDPAGQLIKIIKVRRERRADGEQENPSGPGGSGEDDDDIDGGSSNDEDNESQPDAGPGKLPPFNQYKPESNPKDAHGNYKWKLTTTESEIDPFDYYTADSNGFSAAKFDDWIVYINAFDNSTNVASYTFAEGAWSGTPEQHKEHDSFGLVKKVVFYRYKTRKDRWAAHGGYAPAPDPRDERFYFYRFTGRAGGVGVLGVDLDNSMFCVDRYSKFLFYYSDPDYISGLGVPSGWKDYAQPDDGKHKHFAEPFYMSDPVGYVEENGKVVMYQWVKDKIKANDYTAQKNSSYDKPAERDPGKPGYSPYRDKIKGKPGKSWIKNPEYTVAPISITKQPEPREVIQGAQKWFVQALAGKVPEDEQVTYQWYAAASETSEGGTPVSRGTGGTDSAYYFPTDAVEETYYYCKITNTNPANGQSTSVASKAVKVTVKKGMAVVTIKPPKKGGSLTVMLDGQTVHNGQEVARGSVLTLTASPEPDFTIAGWIKAKPRTDNPLVADVTVMHDITVGIKFKSTAAEKVPLFFFSEDETKGTVQAELNGTALEGGRTGVLVEKDSIVTFIANPTDDYEFDRWAGAISGTEKSKTITIKEKTTTVFALFKLKRFAVTYACDPEEGGSLTAAVDGTPLANGSMVDKKKTVIFKAEAKAGYILDHWGGWAGAAAAGKTYTVALDVLDKVSVKAVFKRAYPVNFSCDPKKGTITAKVDGREISNGDLVLEDQNVTFTVKPRNTAFIIDKWNGIDAQSSDMEKTVLVDKALDVTVDFKHKPMQLSVTPKILNVDLQSWSTEGAKHHANPTYVDGVHLAYKCAVNVTSNGKSASSLWSYMFPVENDRGLWIRTQSEHFITKGSAKSASGTGEKITGEAFTSFAHLKLSLSNYVLKANRHDYWWAEYTTGSEFLGYVTRQPALYPLQALDNNSSFSLTYDEAAGVWKVEGGDIKRSDEIPLPSEYAGTEPDPNRNISYKGVTITYDENFTLAAGEEKDFVITYEVNNDPDSPDLKKISDGTPTGTRSKGTVQVKYEISWK